jgi:hypothetical protein
MSMGEISTEDEETEEEEVIPSQVTSHASPHTPKSKQTQTVT